MTCVIRLRSLAGYPPRPGGNARIRRVPGLVADDAQVLENLPDGHAKTVEHELLMAERHATLREAFARLPLPFQRLLALLAADPPVPYAEISAGSSIRSGASARTAAAPWTGCAADPAIVRLING